MTLRRLSLWTVCGLVLAAAVASVACGSSSGASSSSGAPPRNTPIASVCDGKIISPADLASVLPGSIGARTPAGDPQTCEFSTSDSSSVSSTVRPGLGDVTVSTWASGKMPVDAIAVGGVGDQAAWQSTLHELIATKHNVLCDIGSQGTKGSDADLQKKFAELCDKIWAAR